MSLEKNNIESLDWTMLSKEEKSKEEKSKINHKIASPAKKIETHSKQQAPVANSRFECSHHVNPDEDYFPYGWDCYDDSDSRVIKAISITIDIQALKWNIKRLIDKIIFLEKEIWDLKETNLYKQKCFDYHNSISLDVSADILEDHLFYLILEHKKKALFALLNRVLTSIEKLNLRDYRNVYYEAWYIFPLSNELNPNLLIKN